MATRKKALKLDLASLDRAWEEAHEAYSASIKAGNADPDLAWKKYTLGQLRSAYYLYLDTLED